MNWSVKAIIARFGGNKTAAMLYCREMSNQYQHLRSEYDGYYNAILNDKESK